MTGLFDRDEALGSGPEMPVMPDAAILAVGAHDQADRDAGAKARTRVRYSARLCGMNEFRLGGRVRAEKIKPSPTDCAARGSYTQRERLSSCFITRKWFVSILASMPNKTAFSTRVGNTTPRAA